MPLSVALEKMIREHVHIALVQGGAEKQGGPGKTVGLITLEDIIEGLAGDIQVILLLAVTRPAIGERLGCRRRRAVGTFGRARRREPSGGCRLALLDLGRLTAARPGRPVQGGDTVRSGPVVVIVRSVRRQRLNEEPQINVEQPEGAKET